jgi:hypothetical protein
MPKIDRAQLAAEMFRADVARHGYGAGQAWLAIAQLLLTCKIWRQGWRKFHGVIVYRESNDFKPSAKGIPNKVLRSAEQMTTFLAKELGVERGEVCESIGTFWKHRDLRGVQPNNPVGHAFRSILVEYLTLFGAKGLQYEEEVDPYGLFHGGDFKGRSKEPKIDIVVYKHNVPVALITCRWRYRHDRVDIIDEAQNYVPIARRQFTGCRFYACVGEFSAARLEKILKNAAPIGKYPLIDACVHFAPRLLTEGLGENGRLQHIKSLDWLAEESRSW